MSNKCLYCFKNCVNKYCSNSCASRYYYELRDNLSINNDTHEILEGTLFSDAGLELDRKHRSVNPRYYFKQTLRSREYVELVASYFDLNHKITVVQNGKDKQGNYIFDARFKTGASKTLLSYYNRWYPEGKKIIPKDFKVTPLCLLHAYLGDGYLFNRKSNFGRYKSPCQVFCTNCFSDDDLNNIFIPQLKSVGIDSYIHHHKRKDGKIEPLIFIRTCSYDRFFEYIGPSPVQCLEYKWHTNYNF